VFLDATYCEARVNHRVVSQAVVIANGVRADGWREVLGFAVVDSEDGAFWTAFLRSEGPRRGRGAAGHLRRPHRARAGHLRGAARRRLATLPGAFPCATSSRKVPKGSAEMVTAAIRTIFAQPEAAHVREQTGVIAGTLGRQSVKVETMLRDAAEDLLAFTTFPAAHWKKIWSTNPLGVAQ
jgi:putative transposase